MLKTPLKERAMYNPVTKIVRYFRREYPISTIFAGITAAIGLIVGTAVTLTTGAPLLVIPLCAAGVGVGGFAWNRIGFPGDSRTTENNTVVNGVTVVGSARDIASIN